MNKLIHLCFATVLLWGCDTPAETTQSQADASEPVPDNPTASAPANETYDPASVDEETAHWISNLLVTDYIAEDLDYLEEDQRTYQFFKTDLNDDGQSEYFVRFMNSWFCGSGGCTFFLLSHNGEMITKFTVTNPPLFIEPTKENGWSVLLVKDRGEWKELVYENGTYPPNPTVLPKAPYDAPSGHARILFGEDTGRAKTYTF